MTCGICQLYFYENLFNPKVDSKIQNDKKFKKKAVETLLNELFSLDIENNERTIQQYTSNRQITLQLQPVSESTMVFYILLFTLDR